MQDGAKQLKQHLNKYNEIYCTSYHDGATFSIAVHDNYIRIEDYSGLSELLEDAVTHYLEANPETVAKIDDITLLDILPLDYRDNVIDMYINGDEK